MGNNNLKGANDILVKVDQNNLIYIDPNSILSEGIPQPRGVEPENLVMYVNLEADLVPRSTLVDTGDKSTLMSVAGGTLNFMQNKNGGDYDTTWTDAYTSPRPNISTFAYTPAGAIPIINGFSQNDTSAQSFGIESISIQITGANFIPRVVIKFIDVRGKTLFESPQNSPYAAFFHLPWPIFYLTVKGYYGKAIKYRLHLVKFNSRYNSTTGNIEVETNFVGSTYAYMADISLDVILNAPYFYISESDTITEKNEKTGETNIVVSKSTKGYRTLTSVYKEYINKGFLPKDFPVKTLREIIIMAGRLNKMLENQIFGSVIDPTILAGVKDFEDGLLNFQKNIDAWKGRHLSSEYFVDGTRRSDTNEEISWHKLNGTNEDKNSLKWITGSDKQGSLEQLITTNINKLNENQTFGSKRNIKLLKIDDLDILPISFSLLKKITNFYISTPTIGVDIDGVQDCLDVVIKNFVDQRNALESNIEKRMNTIIKNAVDSNGRHIGLGFEPTVRNIIGVLLANAETYIRLMKDVHDRAFEVGQERKVILGNVLTDCDKPNESIYPWPEVKLQTSGKKALILKYPGSRDMIGKLQSNNKRLWPEVDFVENFYEVATKKADNLPGQVDGDSTNVTYTFDAQTSTNKKDISVLTNITDYIPYTDKSFSSIIYEVYERAKYTTSISPFSNEVMIELANVEFDNLKYQIADDIDIIGMLKLNIKDINSLLGYMMSLSKFDRFPYYEDQLPTISYLKDGLSEDYSVKKYIRNISNTSSNVEEYTTLSKFLSNYKPESYRTSIYPFNSKTYLGYIGQTSFSEKNLYLNGMLYVNTPDDFITSQVDPAMWVKDGYVNNLFTNTIKIDGIDKHILNTPYFHKQLYTDFIKTQPQEKYVGFAYLLLNSLPFKDLDDTVSTNFSYQGINLTNTPTLMSTLFREIGSSHHIPYHMMIKWGSIYHRYKKYIVEGIDIIDGVTTPINGDVFYNNNGSVIYEGIPEGSNVGFHPFYEDIFHQIVNNSLFFDLTESGYTNSILSGVTHLYTGITNNYKTYASFIDSSKFNSTDNRYTLLPTNGYTPTYGSDFAKDEQENFRIIWNVGTSYASEYIDYSGYTFPSYNEYFKLTGTTDTYSLSSNYRKVIDLIATFKSDILDVFEQAFLNFASENLNEEISYVPYDVKYCKFQDLLKKIVSVTKESSDPIDTIGLIDTIKAKQIKELEILTNQMLSTNDNLIKISMANPREIDNYVLGGFTGMNVKNFSVEEYDETQYTVENQNNIKLYIGEDLDLYYKDFFSVNNIELNLDNIIQFRPLLYMYAGLRANNISKIKSEFIDYLKSTIISSVKNDTTNVSGNDDRLNIFLKQLIERKISTLEVKTNEQTTTILNGYNDETLKLETYNYFKSFNDKWTSGNSIGQRNLMEEFLFLDKANKDIGDQVFLDMQKLTRLSEPGNKKINLFSAISLLIQDTGFDIRALPAYINFYGANFSASGKRIPSKNVAQNMFGAFLDVDYQESSPKIILQYIGPTSKHLELSDIDKKQKFKNDGFDIGNPHNNPIIVAPDVFTKTDFSKSNKVVAFEVSFGDQNQSIFKSIELDQATLKNTSESFQVLERLGRNETGSSTAQIDIGLFDIYRSASYQCQVTAMGNMMIQPTMYFYLKNVPLFKGSYLITEVTHNIRTTGIETSFKGTRIPAESLPDPSDSFLASYRPLFDRLIGRARAKVQESARTATPSDTKKIMVTAQGSFPYDMGNISIPGENILQQNHITDYNIPYNGYLGEEYIQLISYDYSPTSSRVPSSYVLAEQPQKQWLRAFAVRMGGKYYSISNDTDMSLISKLTKVGIQMPKKVTWGLINQNPLVFQQFYSSKFSIFNSSDPNNIIYNFSGTEFLNPNIKDKKIIYIKTNINFNQDVYEGPINVGPPKSLNIPEKGIPGFGIGLSSALMNRLGLSDGQVVYFRMVK